MNKEFSTQPIAILGAGSWGTALAIHLAHHNQKVQLWEFDSQQVALLKKDRCNKRYLPNFEFPNNIEIFDDLSAAVKDVEDILLVVPSHAFHQTLTTLKPFIQPKTRIAWATKGIDPKTNHLLQESVIEILGERPMAILSGPSFAKEVAKKLPTVVAIATNDEHFSQNLVTRFNHDAFRVYTSTDMIGVQLGGAIKNVIALAAGASDGLGFGANAISGLITRGLAEMMRLGLAMNAKPETFMGLSGLGDLVLTCTDNQSRNRRFGMLIAQDKTPEEAEHEIGQVVEGAHTAKQVMALAQQYNVEMPICQQVYRVLKQELTPKQAVIELLDRPPKSE